MAIKQEIWDKARLLFEHGKTLAYIHEHTGISKGQISKKSKAENWQKETTKATLVNSEVQNIIMQEEINETKETFSRQERNTHESEVRDKLKAHDKTTRIAENYQDIIEFSVESQMLLLNKLRELRDEAIASAPNTKALVTILHGFNKQYDEIINMAKVKTGVEANDRASITLGHSDRHAPRPIQGVIINTAETDHQSKTIDAEMDDDEAVQIYLDMVRNIK